MIRAWLLCLRLIRSQRLWSFKTNRTGRKYSWWASLKRITTRRWLKSLARLLIHRIRSKPKINPSAKVHRSSSLAAPSSSTPSQQEQRPSSPRASSQALTRTSRSSAWSITVCPAPTHRIMKRRWRRSRWRASRINHPRSGTKKPSTREVSSSSRSKCWWSTVSSSCSIWIWGRFDTL